MNRKKRRATVNVYGASGGAGEHVPHALRPLTRRSAKGSCDHNILRPLHNL